MSKIADVLEVIRDRHVMGTTDGLRDYHAAREAVNKSRSRDPYVKLAKIKSVLHNYNVRVTLGPVADVMITSQADGTGQYTIL